MPVVDGRNPDRIAVREGLQTGAGHCAFAKVTPRFARRSRFGVTGCGARSVRPANPFSSSRMMTSTLGGGFAAESDFVPAAMPQDAASAPIRTRVITCEFITVLQPTASHWSLSWDFK